MDDTVSKGYVFAVAEDSGFYIPEALHVERDDDLMLCEDDKEAAKIAERDGVKLIYGMEDVPDGVYLDTPENRETIAASLELFPEYRTVIQNGSIDGAPGLTGMCFGKG